MKKKVLVFLFFFCFLLGLADLMASQSGEETAELTEGKNSFRPDAPVYAKTLVMFNPKIEVISFKEDGFTRGFVNVFGGLGENFLMTPDRDYEMIVSENIFLIVPK